MKIMEAIYIYIYILLLDTIPTKKAIPKRPLKKSLGILRGWWGWENGSLTVGVGTKAAKTKT